MKFYRIVLLFCFLILFGFFHMDAQGVISGPLKTSKTTSLLKQTQKKSTSKKTVSFTEPDGYINGHGYVDLGLPSGLKWATCNIGASSPFDYGYYYRWGEISDISQSGNCITNVEYEINNYNPSDIGGYKEYDAACQSWGLSWRLPKKKECEELISNCRWEWVQLGNATGSKVTGPNGKSIFLPAGGRYYGYKTQKYINKGDWGCYWTSTPGRFDFSFELLINRNKQIMEEYVRIYARTIRPVSN